MKLEGIISISGTPGLFKLVTQLKNGFIVEELSTGKKSSISNSSQVSLLDNIAMFTIQSEVALFEVFKNIATKENFGKSIEHKSKPEVLKAYMTDVLPDYDDTRVYDSDIKKLIQWYNILHKAGHITQESFVENQAEETKSLDIEEAVVEDKSKKDKQESTSTEKPAKKPEAKKNLNK